MKPLLRSAQVLKQKAEELGYQGKEVAEYVKQDQALDREERQLGEMIRKGKQRSGPM